MSDTPYPVFTPRQKQTLQRLLASVTYGGTREQVTKAMEEIGALSALVDRLPVIEKGGPTGDEIKVVQDALTKPTTNAPEPWQKPPRKRK